MFWINAQSVSAGLTDHAVVRNGPDIGGIACSVCALRVGAITIAQSDPTVTGV